jgi:hypothetical protein
VDASLAGLDQHELISFRMTPLFWLYPTGDATRKLGCESQLDVKCAMARSGDIDHDPPWHRVFPDSATDSRLLSGWRHWRAIRLSEILSPACWYWAGQTAAWFELMEDTGFEMIIRVPKCRRNGNSPALPSSPSARPPYK